MSLKISSALAIGTLLAFGSLTISQPGFACSSSSGSGGVHYGSSMDSESVTVCLDLTQSTSGSTQTSTKTTKKKVAAKSAPKTTVKTTPKPVMSTKQPAAPKPTCPTPAQLAAMPRSADSIDRWMKSICNPTKPKPIAKSAPKPQPKVVAKPKLVAKKITVTSPPKRSTSGAQAVFRPNPITASYYPQTVLAIGQVANFITSPTLHYKMQSLLGKRAEVEFTPIWVTWSFSDSGQLSGSSVGRSFEASGRYQAIAQVSYSVRYRLVGESNWIAVSGRILANSNQLQITVGEPVRNEKEGGLPLIVGQDCLAKPTAIGCDT